MRFRAGSDELYYPDLYEALQSAERSLGRPINPTVIRSAVWKRKRSERDSFSRRIAEQPKLFVIGGEDALP